jgi:hypothetical protein
LPTSISFTTRAVSVLTWDTVREALLATQTEPGVAVMPIGPRPTSTMRVTVWLVSEICETVSEPVFVTHRAPSPTTAPPGC